MHRDRSQAPNVGRQEIPEIFGRGSSFMWPPSAGAFSVHVVIGQASNRRGLSAPAHESVRLNSMILHRAQ